MSKSTRVMVVDDDRAFLVSLRTLLEDEGGFSVESAGSGVEALEILEKRAGIQVIISDLSMPAMDGIGLLREVRASHPEVHFILMAAHATVDTAVQAMRHGAYHYLGKPVDPDELLLQVKRALDLSDVQARYRSPTQPYGDPETTDVLVDSSECMSRLRTTICGSDPLRDGYQQGAGTREFFGHE